MSEFADDYLDSLQTLPRSTAARHTPETKSQQPDSKKATPVADDKSTDTSHLDRMLQSSAKKDQSRAADRLFSFFPGAVSFDGPGKQYVQIRNTSDEAQTIDEWELVGDRDAFQTQFLGNRSVTLGAGEIAGFDVQFTTSRGFYKEPAQDDRPRAASLMVHSMFGQSKPAQLNMAGMNRAGAVTESCAGVKIEAGTPEGRPNSIQSAISSVCGAMNSVLHRQSNAVKHVEDAAGDPVPKPPPWWGTSFDSVIAEGLCRGLALVADRLGAGLPRMAFETLRRVGAATTGYISAWQLHKVNKALHEQVTSSIIKGVTSKGVGLIRESVLKKDEPAGAELRNAFFQAQVQTLTLSYANAVTALNNAEGDYAALDAQAPGLGFAALEAYREHLMCAQVEDIASRNAMSMWSAFVARMELGSHEPEAWERAGSGAALEKNIYNATDAHHRLKHVARGVLEVGVVWSYEHRRDAPIAEIRYARVAGLQRQLKDMLVDKPLGAFAMPIIVHGKVAQSAYTQGMGRKTSQLRIARNEGGAISVGTEPGGVGAEMLAELGHGDSFDGARAMFAHVDRMSLKKVD